ncbi:MAG: pyruvate kinase [Symbiobacteriaceae bacterium]|nr:pyruvate kinase [Symbiobacteriaceae bacterium]
MRMTKIVCTIGPAITDLELTKELIKAGMNVARFNFSHGSHEEHLEKINMVRQAAAELGIRVAIMLDNRGPEIRLGLFEDGKVFLEQGAEFVLTTEEILGDVHRVTVHYDAMPQEVQPGKLIALDDGNLSLKVKRVEGQEIFTEVIIGGELSNRKKVNLPGTVVSLPPLSAKDVEDLLFAVKHNLDFIAASFIRKAEDVIQIRRVLEEFGGSPKIIAKIESQEGLDNLSDIIKVVDGLMVARGDLGVEIPTEEVPIAQKEMIALCNQRGIPVITATHMLDSMMRNPRPTRAEASDVANAIYDGSDAIMLSGETASGKYPIESVQTMARIAERTEEALSQIEHSFTKTHAEPSITDAIGEAVWRTVQTLGAKAVVTATNSGYTARMIAKYHPQVPIIAVTIEESSANQLMLTRGVVPLVAEKTTDTDAVVHNAIGAALDAGYLENGDLAVFTAGVPVGVTGSTNMLQVITIGEVLVRGIVIGATTFVTGRAIIATTARDAEAMMREGDILVVPSLDADYIPAARKAVALITEEGGISSSGVVIGISLNIPVMVGATDATRLIPNTSIITMDTFKQVFRGRAKKS